MERALGVGWKLINFLQQRQLLRLQRVAARAKEVERLSVAEEDGLLALVDDQLRAEVKVLNRVLPDERFVVALIFDDAGKPVLFDLLGCDPLGHIVHAVADRAGVARRGLVRAQADATLRAGKLHSAGLLGHRVDRLMADRAERFFALGLVKHDHVPAVRALAPGQLVRADVDRVPARAVDFLSRKEPRPGFCVFPTVGTFDDKFTHVLHPLLFVREFDVCPVGNVTLACAIVANGKHSPVCLQADCMLVPSTNCHNICPTGNSALAIVVITHSSYSSVCFQANRVIVSRADRHDILPTGNIALAEFIVADSDRGSICFQADRVPPAKADSYNIRPIRSIAFDVSVGKLPRHIIIRNYHSPIRP